MKTHDLYEHFKSVLFTKRCKYCSSVIDVRDDVCENCENGLSRITGEICLKCGCEKDICNCKNNRFVYYRSAVAPFYYEGVIKEAIRQFKFLDKPWLAKSLAEDMALCFDTLYAGFDFDFCTFVPMHKKSKNQRGYNQSELLAKEFCKIENLPCEDILVKTVCTETQHQLNLSERTGNIFGAIDVKDGVNAVGKRILLIDDIKTTGATLNECTKALLIAGAEEVMCLTVAITKKKPKTDRTKY